MTHVSKLCLAALTLPLMLAACGTATPSASVAEGDLTKLSLSAPFPGLQAQGLPTDGAGKSTVTTVTVKVKDAQGQPVTFNGQNVYQKGGAQTTLTLVSTAPSATVLLPRGAYTFENVGTSTGGTFLAYGQNAGVNLYAPANTTVQLDLHALADGAKTTFADKMGWTSVVTQDVLDLRLNLLNAEGTLVPTGDFDAPTYEVVDAGGTPLGGVAEVLATSRLGARVRAIGTTGTDTLYIKATTQAWQATGADTARRSTLSKTFRIAFAKTGLKLDTLAPRVTFAGTGLRVTAGQQTTLKGTASDDSGNVQRIRVYDGVQLIGSTDIAEFGANGVGEISFAGGAWTLPWTPASSGAPEITVIASDKAGNEGRRSALKFAGALETAGGFHNVALREDGSLVAWGFNTYGQATVPAGLNDVVVASAGYLHSLALKSDGTVVAWGLNDHGQTNVPAGLGSVAAISTGGYHNLALKLGGTVVAWGSNEYGQSAVPAGLSGVQAISAGYLHSLVLKDDGTLVGWGRNAEGQASVPSGLSGVSAISAGAFHNLALKSDGTVVAWGYNAYGQTSVPADLSGVVAISAGSFHSLALKSDGTVVAWGLNSDGRSTVPAGLSGVVAISAGDNFSLALRRDGTVVTWGNNERGQTNVPTGAYLVP